MSISSMRTTGLELCVIFKHLRGRSRPTDRRAARPPRQGGAQHPTRRRTWPPQQHHGTETNNSDLSHSTSCAWRQDSGNSGAHLSGSMNQPRRPEAIRIAGAEATPARGLSKRPLCDARASQPHRSWTVWVKVARHPLPGLGCWLRRSLVPLSLREMSRLHAEAVSGRVPLCQARDLGAPGPKVRPKGRGRRSALPDHAPSRPPDK